MLSIDSGSSDTYNKILLYASETAVRHWDACGLRTLSNLFLPTLITHFPSSNAFGTCSHGNHIPGAQTF